MPSFISPIHTRLLAAAAALVLGVLALPSAAAAQADAGALRVLVTDQTEAIVPGATVDVTNAATGVTQSGVSDMSGYAQFSPLPRGLYTVRVSLPGFQTVEVTGLRVDVNERRFLPVTLAVASASETVEVVSRAAVIQTEEGSLGQVIKGEVAVELPLAGRRYTELALLVPGTAASTMTVETRGPGWFVSNGNYHTQNNFILDGFDNNQGTQNAQSLSAQVVQPSPDAIGEFKVQTNSFSAEFGRSAGAVVNVSLKSGTNATSGSAFYYNRDKALAATSWRANLIGAEKEDLEWHQGGATLGGPLARNRTFYFTSYEGFRRNFSNTFLVNVPTEAQRNGVFNTTVRDPRTGAAFPNNTIPRDRWDPLGAKLLALYPSPNLPGRAAAGGRIIENYGVQRPGNETTHKLDVRLDHLLGSADRLMARFSFLQQDIYRDAIFEGLGDGVGNQGEQYNRNQSFGVSWTKIIGSRMVNEARVGYNRTHSRFAHATANDQTAAEFGFAGLPDFMSSTGGLPLISPSNYNALGTRNFRPQYQNPHHWQFQNTLTLASGAHAIRAGVEVRIKNNELVDIVRRTPAYTFTGQVAGESIADLLLGVPRQLSATTMPVVDWAQQAYAGFIQDDWKVRPDLTINLGLRYEYTTPFYGAGENTNVNFDFNTGQLVFPTDGDKYLMDPDRNNVAPRLGFAWQATPERVVVRGGFGMFYSMEDMRGSEGIIALNPPALIQAAIVGTGTSSPIGLSDPFPANFLSNYNPSTVSVKARERDQQAATVYQWNLATEVLLPFETTMELAYVGNAGRNLLTIVPVNTVEFGRDGSVAANRPYPGWQQVENNITRGRSSYHALQAKLERRLSRGFYALASYTYARAEDEIGAWGAGANGVQARVNPDLSNVDEALRGERGPNGQIPRHRFTLTEVWQLPIGRGRAIGADMPALADAIVGGWQLSTIWTLRSGLPVNVSLAGNGVDPNTGQSYSFLNRNGGALRPNLVGDPNANSDANRDRFAFLDPRAYQLQPVNTPGNAPRNSAWGPGYFTVDASLVKRFAVGVRHVDLRLEAFNLLNTTNYQNPNGTWGSSNFGVISDTFDPRVVQVALRFAF
ncbi:MAG: TonB-dependent receptor domain-containing protein [Vicinamibacteria bacterium]